MSGGDGFNGASAALRIPIRAGRNRGDLFFHFFLSGGEDQDESGRLVAFPHPDILPKEKEHHRVVSVGRDSDEPLNERSEARNIQKSHGSTESRGEATDEPLRISFFAGQIELACEDARPTGLIKLIFSRTDISRRLGGFARGHEANCAPSLRA